MNGWILKHCYYDEVGNVSETHYSIMVEKKFFGITYRGDIVDKQYHYKTEKIFSTEVEAEEYLLAYLRNKTNKNPINNWTKDIVKSIHV